MKAVFLFFAFLLSYAYLPPITGCESCVQPENEWKKTKQKDMELAWKVEQTAIHCRIQSPGTGWAAVGFNTKPGLAGTHLIMGKVINGKVAFSDRYVLRPGLHQPINELGGTSTLSELSGTESQEGTQLEFSFPLTPSDKYHHELIPGKEYHLLLAWSREDDFMHHSAMRTHFTIIL